MSYDNYKKGKSDFSVTELIKPPRITQLEKRYNDDIEVDCSDRLWSVFGSAVHNIFDKHSNDESKTEERFFVDILKKKVGGQVDHFENNIISDYKVTSAYSILYGSKIAEWETQLNCYAYILTENGHTISELQIIAILRDWSRRDALLNENYPQIPIVVIPIKLWSAEEQYEYLCNRVRLHTSCEKLKDSMLPECSKEERWQSPNKYAIMKEGGKRAVKVFDDFKSAEDWIELQNDKNYLMIKKREGVATRCKDYCTCKNFCNQYKAQQ